MFCAYNCNLSISLLQYIELKFSGKVSKSYEGTYPNPWCASEGFLPSAVLEPPTESDWRYLFMSKLLSYDYDFMRLASK